MGEAGRRSRGDRGDGLRGVPRIGLQRADAAEGRRRRAVPGEKARPERDLPARRHASTLRRLIAAAGAELRSACYIALGSQRSTFFWSTAAAFGVAVDLHGRPLRSAL